MGRRCRIPSDPRGQWIPGGSGSPAAARVEKGREQASLRASEQASRCFFVAGFAATRSLVPRSCRRARRVAQLDGAPMSERGLERASQRHLRIFISYRRQDDRAVRRAAVRRPDRALYGEAQVFMDIEAIEVGADFEQVIVETIAGADVVLAVVGPHWVTATDERRAGAGWTTTTTSSAGSSRLALQQRGPGHPDPRPGRRDARGARPAPVDRLVHPPAGVRCMSDRRWRAEVAELIGAVGGLAPRNADASPGR